MTDPDSRRLGVVLTLFAASQVLHALSALAYLAVTLGKLAGASQVVTVARMGDASSVAALRVVAIAVGLWLLWRRHPGTPRYWTAYFVLSFCGAVIAQWTREAPSYLALAIPLAWLAFWVTSPDVRRVFGARGLD